jgi:asparagine N-glycosylation enzyme membrane subunit Stt3
MILRLPNEAERELYGPPVVALAAGLFLAALIWRWR